MGTLGCISDMLRRDKENRELRKVGKRRMNDTRNRLIDLGKKKYATNISVEQLEEIIQKTQEKEEAEKNHLFRIKLIMFGLIAIIGLILGIIFTLFF